MVSARAYRHDSPSLIVPFDLPLTHGNSTVMGAVITGLNVKTGMNVAPGAGGGHIGSLQRVRNGWTDTWSSY